jgi:hypothetical protein
MADGFSVDLDALENAGRGVAGLVTELSEHKITDLRCDSSRVGHDRLAGTLSSFCERWQIGVANLSKDGDSLVANLTSSAQSYRDTDGQLAAAFAKVTR